MVARELQFHGYFVFAAAHNILYYGELEDNHREAGGGYACVRAGDDSKFACD